MKLMKAKYIAAAILLFAAGQAPAQNKEQRLTPEVMARLFPAGVVSPQYNPDGSVSNGSDCGWIDDVVWTPAEG